MEGRPQKPGNNTPELERLDHLRKRYCHDEFCKENLRDLDKARKFLKLMLKPEIIDLLDLERLELSQESFLDEDLKKLYGDVLYQVPVKNSNENIIVFVLIELKTENDKWVLFQLAKYIIRIWDKEYRKAENEGRLADFKLPTVIPLIFHHGESRFTASTELIKQVRVLQGLEQYTLNMKSFLFDVTPLGEKDLPEDLELCVLIMVLQAVFSEDVVVRLLAIYKKLRPKLHEPRYKKLWDNCVFYATTSSSKFKTEDRLKIINEIQTTGDRTMATTLWDQLIEEGKAEGKTEGKAEGKAEGEAKAIVLVLKTRLGRVPKSIKDAVHAITDSKTLEKLTKLAVTCKSLAEFEKALKK